MRSTCPYPQPRRCTGIREKPGGHCPQLRKFELTMKCTVQLLVVLQGTIDCATFSAQFTVANLPAATPCLLKYLVVLDADCIFKTPEGSKQLDSPIRMGSNLEAAQTN